MSFVLLSLSFPTNAFGDYSNFEKTQTQWTERTIENQNQNHKNNALKMLHHSALSALWSIKDFDAIQEKVDAFVCPADVGRITSKLSSKFSGVLYFSLYADYKCWQLFVRVSLVEADDSS